MGECAQNRAKALGQGRNRLKMFKKRVIFQTNQCDFHIVIICCPRSFLHWVFQTILSLFIKWNNLLNWGNAIVNKEIAKEVGVGIAISFL